MKKSALISAAIIACCILHTACCFSQGTAINSSGVKADSSAMLDVSSNNKGMLIPRVSLTGTTDITTIPNPANSLLVFDTLPAGDITETGYYYWDGGNSKWIKLATGSTTSGSSCFGDYQVFDNDGTFNVPAGITKLKVEVWGSGGGGSSNYGYGAGGGGGGGYLNAIIDNLVSSYNIIIGNGGAPSTNGQASSFSGGGITLNANGGDGASSGGGGAGGGTSITGTPLSSFSVSGTPGGSGVNGTNHHGSGGSAGCGGGGGAGGGASCPYKNGVSPGGGGGGGYSPCNPGSGANGRVIVWW